MSDRPFPVRQDVMSDLATHGEATILAQLQDRPPEWIVLMHRDNLEHGAQFFGRDFGREIAVWVARHYKLEPPIGARPFSGHDFGLIIGRLRQPDESTRTP